MADRTAIEWTDATWNPVLGCTKVSPGCDVCYAIINARIRAGNPNPKIAAAYAGLVERDTRGQLDWTSRINLVPNRLDQPMRWQRSRRIFVNAQSDLFHANIPRDYIAQVFAVMGLARWHTFQVLTKRHGPARSMLASDEFRDAVRGWAFTLLRDPKTPLPRGTRRVLLERHETQWEPILPWPLPNVWHGVSVEDQTTARRRIPALRETPAAVRFLSCEPLLGPVVLPDLDRIDWVIAGGESGPGARPAHPDWVRSLRDQCTAANVPFLFKQWGAHRLAADLSPILRGRRPVVQHLGVDFVRLPKKIAGRDLDGRTWDQYPSAANTVSSGAL